MARKSAAALAAEAEAAAAAALEACKTYMRVDGDDDNELITGLMEPAMKIEIEVTARLGASHSS